MPKNKKMDSVDKLWFVHMGPNCFHIKEIKCITKRGPVSFDIFISGAGLSFGYKTTAERNGAFKWLQKAWGAYLVAQRKEATEHMAFHKEMLKLQKSIHKAHG